MNTTTHYELGGRTRFSANVNGSIAWKNKGGIEGILAWARDERTGEYVRVYEHGPTEWVDNEPLAWSSGNFETIENAQRFASMAYRWINKERRGR